MTKNSNQGGSCLNLGQLTKRIRPRKWLINIQVDEEEAPQAQRKDRRRRAPFYLKLPIWFTFTWDDLYVRYCCCWDGGWGRGLNASLWFFSFCFLHESNNCLKSNLLKLQWSSKRRVNLIRATMLWREIQDTGPGNGIDAHAADRARLHARVYNCTTQLQRVLDNKSFDLVPSHAGEKITNANTNRTRELEWAGCKKSKKGFGIGNTLIAMDFGTTKKTLWQRGTAGRPKGDTLMTETQWRKRES